MNVCRFHLAIKDRKPKRRLRLTGYLAGLAMMAAILTGPLFTVSAYAEEAATENKTEIYYKGKVTATVNVRVNAGEKNEKLVHNGKGVQLQSGEEVVILEEVMVEDKAWYHVRFERDDKVLEGYSTSSYITKTTTTITPTPTPSPIPSPTPEPTPTAPITPEPTVVPVDTDGTGGSGAKESKTGIVVGIAVVGGLALIGAGAFVLYRRNHPKQESSELTEAVKKLQKVEVKSPEPKKSNGVKPPEIRPAKKEGKQKEKTTGRAPGVYVKTPAEPVFQDFEELTQEERYQAVAKENEEKQALRKELDELREHDLVEHKYFGKGEVFDNTDVKLIEIRFGNDTRFLSKDTLAAKKLLKKCEEAGRRWRY